MNKNIKNSLKDGALWGLGHTSSIFLFGILMLLLKVQVEESLFSGFEALVGFMLLVLGIWRLVESYRNFYKKNSPKRHKHSLHKDGFLAYSIGIIHGLAGSGALILLVLSQSKSTTLGMIYLALFGFGSIIGMVLASGILSLPMLSFFKKYRFIPLVLSVLSGILSLGVGYNLLIQNI